MEEWKDVEGYKGIYQISNEGNVKSLDRISRSGRRLKGRAMKVNKNKFGYKYISLQRAEGKGDYKLIHRLVGIAFIPNYENKPQINHIDCCKSNNCISNLEWTSREENMQHASKMGLLDSRPGEKHNMVKLKEWQIKEIRESYIPRKITLQMLGDKYGVCFQTISLIVNNKTWVIV